MKKLLILVLLSALLLPATTLAAGRLVITQEVFFVRPMLSYYASETYAEVTNTGDRPVKYNGGMIELYDVDGNSIESSNIYSMYPPILGPGEVGYIYDTTSVREAEEKSYIDDYLLTITSKGENEETITYLPSEGWYGEYQRSAYTTEYRLVAAITNDTAETLDNISVVIALYDKDDNLIYADSVRPYSIGVPSGQSIEFRTTVDSRILEAWEQEELEPARIVTIAYSED